MAIMMGLTGMAAFLAADAPIVNPDDCEMTGRIRCPVCDMRRAVADVTPGFRSIAITLPSMS